MSKRSNVQILTNSLNILGWCYGVMSIIMHDKRLTKWIVLKINFMKLVIYK